MEFKWKPIERDPEGIFAQKQDYFTWAKQWSFAQPKAQEPKDFVYAVRCNIQDQAAEGFMIDVENSRGKNLVYRRLQIGVQLSERDCEGLARKVLNLTE